jgi:hypothetical protein
MKLLRVSPLIFVVLAGCGPGDGDIPISKGYVLFDPGGVGRMISYRGDKRPNEVVIDPRVDTYIVDGEKIIVARRPLTAINHGVTTDWKLLPTCEYWMIDTETHAVEEITDASKWPSVRCY